MGLGDYEPGGDLDTGSKFADQPGTYHFCITDIDENPTKKDGTLVENAAFRIATTICAGTNPSQVDRILNFTFYHPKPTDKNEGAFAKKKIDRFLVATGLLTEKQVREKARVRIDLAKADGAQFVAKVGFDDDDNEKKYLRLSFVDIYHVDDPEVAGIPKNPKMLSLIDPKLRLLPGNKPNKPQPVAATSEDLGDL